MTTVNSRQIRSLDLIILGCLTSNFLYLSVSTFYGEVISTGGDNSNKVCFGRNTKFFRESGDFAGNWETWDNFRKILDIFRTLKKKNRDNTCKWDNKKISNNTRRKCMPLDTCKECNSSRYETWLERVHEMTNKNRTSQRSTQLESN